MDGIVFVPKRYSGYCVALQIVRYGSGYQVFLLGSDFDQEKKEDIVGAEVRGGFFWEDFWEMLRSVGSNRFPMRIGNIVIHEGQAPNEIKFVRDGQTMNLGDLLSFLEKRTSFKRAG